MIAMLTFMKKSLRQNFFLLTQQFFKKHLRYRPPLYEKGPFIDVLIRILLIFHKR